MKSLIAIFTFLILFSGCSRNNAFSEFNMDKKQELSISSLKSSKIISQNGEIDGIFSAIYLNEVYPESFNGDEYFFIFMFVKNSKDRYVGEKYELIEKSLKLNAKSPIKIQELPENNKFSHLVSSKSDWNSYYLVAFKQDSTINLVFETDQSSSAVLTYQKDNE